MRPTWAACINSLTEPMHKITNDESGNEHTCKLCGGEAALRHTDLRDRLLETPGVWQTRQCAGLCGLAWIDPQPTPAQLAAAYESYYTHTTPSNPSRLKQLYYRMRSAYLSSRFGYTTPDMGLGERLGGWLLSRFPHRRAAFDASVMWLPAVPGGHVLEIGCGNGSLLTHLQSLGWSAHGVESDRTAATIAQERGLDIAYGELAAQSFEPGTFDAIVMNHVIEHVADPAALLLQCRRLLKPGGQLVVLTPNVNALGHEWFGKNWLHLDAPRHLNLFTANAITLACRAADFSDMTCESTIRDANWTLGASLALRRTGHYRIGELSFSLRAAGLLLMMAEWIAMKFRDDSGEELLVVAHVSMGGSAH